MVSRLAVTCPTLRKPENGALTGCHGNQAQQFNTSCHITCNTGYRLTGSSVRRCLENGEWSGLDTRCRGITSEYSKQIEMAGIKIDIC